MPDVLLPLAGIRVLDVTNRLGAYGGRLLADFGADVVKIEPPGGSKYRNASPRHHRDGLSLAFSYFEANKRGVELDVRDPTSRESLRRLAENVDVILLTPSVREPVIGFDPTSRALDWAPESAIVVAITPFGTTGPLRDWRGTHLISCAMSGLLIQQGPAEGPPVVIPGEQMYAYVGVNVAIAVFAALRQRSATGEPSRADLSAHEILASTNFVFFNFSSASQLESRSSPSRVEHGGMWELADGYAEYIVSGDKQWDALRQLLGNPPGLDDPALANPLERRRRTDELVAVMAPILRAMPREHFVTRGQELGVPAALVNSIEEFVADPQPKARNFFVPIDLGGVAVQAPGPPFRSSRVLQHPYRRSAPTLGELQAADVIAQWRAERAGMSGGAPLEGLRVISFGTVIAGGLTGTVLADLGADVVKIESPARPDNIRSLAAVGDPVTYESSGTVTSAGFASMNRSVRSLAMDMRQPAAVDLFLELVRAADVVIDNFNPRVMPSWGLAPARLAAENPQLVQLSITGFGHTEGPRSHYAAYGATVCSFLGLTRGWGYSSQTHFDYASQSHAVLAVLAALAARDRDGTGTFIDLAMAEVGGALMGPAILDWTANSHEVVLAGNRVDGSAWSGVIPVLGRDSWVAIEAESDDDWRTLVATIGLPELALGDETIEHALADWFADKSPMQAARILQRAGVAAAPVQNTGDLYRDPQLRARGGIVEIPHPDLGPIEFIAPVHRLGSTAAPVRSGAPRLGVDSDSVLADWLGLKIEERERLATDGAYWRPADD